MGDDSENHTSSTRICEVCHTVTSYHRYNTTAQSNKNHNNAANCTTCHSHKDGFMPFGGACNTCHGASGDTGAPLITGDLVQPPDATGSVTAGKHQKHVVDKDYPCNYCHTGYSMPDSTNHRIDIGFYLFGGAYQGGTYNGQSTATYNSSEQNTTVSNSGSKTCSNVYCHGKLPDGTIWGGGKNTSPQWDGSVTCTSCHDTGGSLSDLSGKHRKHTNESTYAYTCEKCHYETASGSSSIKNETYHVNNTKDLIFSKGGSFDSGTKSCTSTYCHSNARGGAPNVQPQWTSANAMQCDSCHNGRTGIETLEMRSNGHDRLVSSDWVRHYPCYYCHDATVNTSNGIKDYSKHVDENKDVVINSNWYISGNPVPSYNSNTKVCSNIYCHSDGTTVNPEVRPFAWTDGRTKCNTCHGHPTGTCGTCHNDGRTGWSAGQEWKSAMPMYTNTGPGTERANTHARHMLTDFTCDNCHDNTITNQSCNTTGCHTGSGTMDEINHINPAYHVNKTKDVAFKNGGTYNQVTKTCSNTACHTGADPQWGDSVNNTVICLSCHGTSNTDVDDFAKFNGTRAKINLTEWETTGHGRPTSAGNYPSGNPPANFPGNPCWYCHDNNILHNDSSNPFRLKQHQQFNSRFEKECVYCHMQGLDSECMNCHNASNSLAPQLTAITNPPFSQDHSGYTNGLTSCVTSCHATDAQRHNTGAGLWTAGQKVDIRNQYLMMGVCLQCHDDDSNGKCNQCHTGEQYKLGYDPGTGFIKANVSKATSVHFGYKHYAAYQNNGVWKGGKFCWDCHDPHGDSNIYMIQNKVATETDGTYGIPATRRDVSFTRKQSGLDYAKTSAPYNGICNVCHTETGQHYRFDYGDGHNAGRICTTCHEHRFSDSHASGKECNTCHLNKPIPRHTGFGLPRDCTKCHNGTINSRMDIMGQFRANSHHVQADKVTNKHCYSCHWEATVVGLINTDYHSGYNYKTHTSVKNAAVDLVIWGPGTRPEEYNAGTTAVTFTANKIGTADERTEVSKATQHCLGCHSDQNRETQPFNIADPDNGDCKTPAQYAWDRTSIGARYSQTGTATWGKYTSITNAAKKDISKAFSAHGNATANAGGWDAATGLDGTITNTRNGGQNIQCFDCHSSHGSKAAGVTSSYKTFNGTYNGANLKETQAGKGGYGMTYKAAANTTGVNPYNAGAGQCFDCHETATSGTKPWGYNSTYGATAAIMGYKDTSRFGQGTKGSTARYSYRASKATIVGGHFKASSSLKGLDGTPGTDDEAMGTINGLCTPCHDPHGVSPTLGDNQQYALPLLKGTWLTSPYKEDATPMDKDGYSGKSGFYNYRNYWDGSYVRPYPQKANPQPNNAWKTDRNTFNTVDLSNKANVPDSTYGRINEDDTKFAGLCLMCHPKNRLTDGTNKNSAFKTMDRIHETVKGWGTNGEHTYPCSKCHQPHNSGLPRLMQTNCLDYKHRGRVASGGLPYAYDAPSTWYYLNQYGRFPYGWWDDGFGTYSTAICHGAATANGSANWPDNQKWNSVTEW
ncbi:MAG: CxxxxCH/CxxCH domain-containing protein [Nitrospirae bacterium]|nr:CxxxxCH/CxxCH domain-containing protein [Nitrospirota bacterium]